MYNSVTLLYLPHVTLILIFITKIPLRILITATVDLMYSAVCSLHEVIPWIIVVIIHIPIPYVNCSADWNEIWY